jgi:hypothetical protein
MVGTRPRGCLTPSESSVRPSRRPIRLPIPRSAFGYGRRPTYPEKVDEKPTRSTVAVSAIDTTTLSRVVEATRALRRVNSEQLAIVTETLRGFDAIKVDAIAWSKTVTGIKANGLPFSEAMRPMKEAQTRRLFDTLKTTAFTPSFRMGISDMLRTASFPAAYGSQVAEVLAATRRPPADFARFAEALGQPWSSPSRRPCERSSSTLSPTPTASRQSTAYS